jgi:hypothetical protein
MFLFQYLGMYILYYIKKSNIYFVLDSFEWTLDLISISKYGYRVCLHTPSCSTPRDEEKKWELMDKQGLNVPLYHIYINRIAHLYRTVKRLLYDR